MSVQNTMVNAVDPEGKWMYRAGCVSALIIGIGYLFTFPVFAAVGVAPGDMVAQLLYYAEHTAAWWTILGLMVSTNLLYIPVWLALVFALRKINRSAMLVATALIGAFIVLEIAVSYTSKAALITLGVHYAAATTDIQRAAYMAAASYAAAVLESPLASICSILIPSLGALITSLVMFEGVFNEISAYLGLLVGISGIVAVVGMICASPLGNTYIINAILMNIWIFFISYELYKLSQ